MILGIDPGIRKLGYALIEDDLTIVDAGVLLLKHSPKEKIMREDYRYRMGQMYDFFEKMLATYGDQIGVACVEKLFFMNRNQSNAEFVFGIRGALMMLFHRHDVRLIEYTPIQLKKYITSNSKASKELMMSVVKNLYGLTEDLEWHDTADALGLAYLASKV